MLEDTKIMIRWLLMTIYNGNQSLHSADHNLCYIMWHFIRITVEVKKKHPRILQWTIPSLMGQIRRKLIIITASNLCLLLQKEQNVKGGEGPSGKQAVGKTMEHGKLCWHIFNHK